ncbi:hypothetical protein [Bordetella sp. N]|uniref:hypothetical protein n=1 Tax=Bordetella sp. N TaxID=1746199 RepID=UPI0007100B2E|nr:hypothetical protein [Bordetella sp. N]ALM84592.1 hypothetical protein ASB57_17840 [Bordetella sp. N]
MSKPNMPHTENESTSHSAQPTADQPPTEPNRDKYTNSGYPAGGELRQEGKDEYGRDADRRKQAGLDPLEDQTTAATPPSARRDPTPRSL